jgi:hypothetical protein
VDDTEFGYLNGVTSSIQTQLDSKQALITTSARLGADKVGNGDVSNAQLSFLNSATSNVQTQIDDIQTQVDGMVNSNPTDVQHASINRTVTYTLATLPVDSVLSAASSSTLSVVLPSVTTANDGRQWSFILGGFQISAGSSVSISAGGAALNLASEGGGTSGTSWVFNGNGTNNKIYTMRVVNGVWTSVSMNDRKLNKLQVVTASTTADMSCDVFVIDGDGVDLTFPNPATLYEGRTFTVYKPNSNSTSGITCGTSNAFQIGGSLYTTIESTMDQLAITFMVYTRREGGAGVCRYHCISNST